MNTKLLMMLSSLLMAVCGLLLQFFPHEFLNYFSADSKGILPLLVQMISALYLGIAMMNWMAQTVLIGGIYARPLAMGNFLHFTVGAFALLKYAYTAQNSLAIWVPAIVYSVLAILFGIVLFTHPLKTDTAAEK
jgi:hypothetical protein